MGKEIGAISSGLGWEITVWKLSVEPPRAEGDFMSESGGGLRPGQGFTEIIDVVEVEDDVSGEGSVPKIDLDLGAGSKPVLDFGDVSTEFLPVFEDYQGDTFVKVGEIEIDEGLKTRSEPVPNTPTGETLTGEQMRKKRIKTTTR